MPCKQHRWQQVWMFDLVQERQMNSFQSHPGILEGIDNIELMLIEPLVTSYIAFMGEDLSENGVDSVLPTFKPRNSCWGKKNKRWWERFQKRWWLCIIQTKSVGEHSRRNEYHLHHLGEKNCAAHRTRLKVTMNHTEKCKTKSPGFWTVSNKAVKKYSY